MGKFSILTELGFSFTAGGKISVLHTCRSDLVIALLSPHSTK